MKKNLLHIRDPRWPDHYGPLRDVFDLHGYTTDVANAMDPSEYKKKLQENPPSVVLLEAMADFNAAEFERGKANTAVGVLDALQQLRRQPVILIPEEPFMSPEMTARVEANSNMAIFDPLRWIGQDVGETTFKLVQLGENPQLGRSFPLPTRKPKPLHL